VIRHYITSRRASTLLDLDAMEIEIARLKKEARLTDKKIGQKARAEGLVSTADKLAAWLPEGDKTKRWTACAVGTILQGFIRESRRHPTGKKNTVD
jgi:hypothetical protein